MHKDYSKNPGIQFYCMLLFLCISLQAAGAASSSQDNLVPLSIECNIRLCGDDDAEVSIPLSHCTYATLLKDLTADFYHEQAIPFAGRRQRVLENMKRLLSLRARTSSCVRLQEMIVQDDRLCALDDEESYELFCFGDYIDCDRISMRALVRTYASYFLRRLSASDDLIYSVDADNAKLWVKPIINEINKGLLTRIPVQSQALKGHISYISEIVFTRDGTKILSGALDGTIRVWDAKTGEFQRAFTEHEGVRIGRIETIAITPDDRWAFVGSNDSFLRIWNIETGVCHVVSRSEGNWCYVSSLAISNDGTRSMYGLTDKNLLVGNPVTGGEWIHRWQDHTDSITSVAFSPDGTLGVSGSYDKTVRVWDIKTGACVHILKGHTSEVRLVAVNREGTKIISGERRCICVWDIKTGRWLYKLCIHSCPPVIFNAAGTRYITGTWEGDVEVWDIKTGERICKLRAPGDDGYIYAAAYSPDETTIVTGSNSDTVRIWSRVSYENDLQKIIDIEELRFLLRAAQDWVTSKPHKVRENNDIYKNLISRFAFLNDERLFTVVKVQDRIAELQKCESTDKQSVLFDQVLAVYDDYYDVRKNEDPVLSDDAILREFMENFTPRTPIWRILFEARDMLGSNYEVKREERETRQLQNPVSSSQAASSSEEHAASPEQQLQTGVRLPDQPYMMRLFDDADPNQL